MFLRRRLAYLASLWLVCIAPWSSLLVLGEEESRIEFYREVQPLLTKYCAGCHNEQETEGDFRCDTLDGLLKGTPNKRVVEAGKASSSHLIGLIKGTNEPKMPPEDEAQPTSSEIALLERWIDGGLYVDSSSLRLKDRLKIASGPTPTIEKNPITSLLLLEDGQSLLVGRYNELTTQGIEGGDVVRRLDQVIGKVTSLRWSPNRSQIIVASGVAGVGGQITLIDAKTLQIKKQIEGHRDTLYSAVISPDGSTIASAGYDRRIHLWDASTGELIKSLDGHNGAIYDLDFHPNGKLLVSCSADETSKVWDVSTGKRLDTLSQGEAEQYACRFTTDGNRVIAAGADRRIRAWRLISRTKEAINPMVAAVFAHERAILWFRLSVDGRWIVTAGEDRTIKLWTANRFEPVGAVGTCRDIPSDAVWQSDDSLLVATLSGDLERFSLSVLMQRFRENNQADDKPEDLAHVDDKELNDKDNDEAAPMNTVVENGFNNDFKSAIDVALPVTFQATIFRDTKTTPDSKKDMSDSTVANMTGKIASAIVDEDWLSFMAEKGETWILTATATAPKQAPSKNNAKAETKAQQAKAKRMGDLDVPPTSLSLDPRIEIRDATGAPLLRTRLQAVRESYFTFRGKSSSVVDDFRLHRWEDMEINEYLYAGGEVVKLWLYPRGPDSGFKVYPGEGNRTTYFNTTPLAHAMGEPAWIVRELAADESPAPNGLPVFPIYFENDDDPTRKTGKNSRLVFNVPASGKYFVRVRDARGVQDSSFTYDLTIRAPKPNFRLTVTSKEKDVTAGAGTEFIVNADRIDDFNGPIRIDLKGLPPNVIATNPLVIEREQIKAIGTIFIPEDSGELPETISLEVRGIAMIDGQRVLRTVKEPLSLKVSDRKAVKTRFVSRDDVMADEIKEIVIRPGETISTFIAVERGDEKDDVPYGRDDSGRNLPHGIFVDNIGLSGLVIKPGQNTREVFITAAPWVKPQTRPFHLRSELKGNPTTKPIMLRVVAP